MENILILKNFMSWDEMGRDFIMLRDGTSSLRDANEKLVPLKSQIWMIHIFFQWIDSKI